MLDFCHQTPDSKNKPPNGVQYSGGKGSYRPHSCQSSYGARGNAAWAEACGRQAGTDKEKAEKLKAIYCKAGGVRGCK